MIDSQILILEAEILTWWKYNNNNNSFCLLSVCWVSGAIQTPDLPYLNPATKPCVQVLLFPMSRWGNWDLNYLLQENRLSHISLVLCVFWCNSQRVYVQISSVRCIWFHAVPKRHDLCLNQTKINKYGNYWLSLTNTSCIKIQYLFL